jgi:DNA-binding LytR/AlgR family response regulator
MIRCIIVDDEPLAQDILETHIRRFGRLELVARCAHALDAFQLLQKEPVDLMFLDIRMPSISGIEFLKALKNPPEVIFTTAYMEFAHTGFEMDAIDYLLKPISYERFEKSMRKLFRTLPEEKTAVKEYTYFKVSGKLVKVLHTDLLYAQSVKDYIQLRTTRGSLLTHMTMKNLAELLPRQNFVRVHRSYLVNIKHIDRLEKNSVMIADAEIPVGENYRDGLGEIWRQGK